MRSATPPGPYPSYMISSYETPGSSPVPRRMARSMFSRGILFALASAMMVRSRGFVPGSPPPLRAATVSSLIMRVKALPRLASAAPFLCLIVCHLEWPDMGKNSSEYGGNPDRAFYHAVRSALVFSVARSASENHPDIGARIPRPAAIIAQKRGDLKTGLFKA